MAFEYIFAIVLISAMYLSITATLEFVMLFEYNHHKKQWWVTPRYLKYETNCGLNAFGRWLFSITLWIANPLWTLVCFVKFLCTVGYKEK